MMALVTQNVEWKYSPSGLFRPSRFADKESKAQKVSLRCILAEQSHSCLLELSL